MIELIPILIKRSYVISIELLWKLKSTGLHLLLLVSFINIYKFYHNKWINWVFFFSNYFEPNISADVD